MPARGLPKCPLCFETLHRLYYKTQDRGKVFWNPRGWVCHNCNLQFSDDGKLLIQLLDIESPEILRKMLIKVAKERGIEYKAKLFETLSDAGIREYAKAG